MLLTKYGFAAQKIARKMLTIEVNQRIPRISDFASELSLGRGTIQGALRFLEENQAIRVESRGHLGTFLLAKDNHKLLQFSGIGQLIGAMPLPYSKKYEGLATGLTKAFKKKDLPFHLAYMRGSLPRVKAMLDGRYDFAIVSRLAAELICKQDPAVQIGLTFGPFSYVSGHSIFLSHPEYTRIESGMKIGIDHTSDDQRELTLAECEGLDVTFIELSYMNLLDMLEIGQIDAAIWNKDEVGRNAPLMKQIPLSRSHAKKIEQKITEACLLIKAEQTELQTILSMLSVEEILETQKKVETKQILPHY
ncbi:GntR family transcriptional regulator YhfZ [Seinonella peptonophila]|nr:GntR family transcriptional regulator YhfZ [Seinonella peptonophila]